MRGATEAFANRLLGTHGESHAHNNSPSSEAHEAEQDHCETLPDAFAEQVGNAEPETGQGHEQRG
jgi:hypothetical protein